MRGETIVGAMNAKLQFISKKRVARYLSHEKERGQNKVQRFLDALSECTTKPNLAASLEQENLITCRGEKHKNAGEEEKLNTAARESCRI